MDKNDAMLHTLQPVPGGFDYEFLSPLDTKYECPICLLALRQPVQTSCGHRFCNLCIRSWINDRNKECPIDKSELANSDLFFDNFVEREVLNLKVRCTNAKLGCKWQADLKYIDDHVQACMFKPVMCPNECSATVLQNELDEHLTSQCIHRLAYCPHCSKAYTFSKAQIHMTHCPAVKIPCELCGCEIVRKDFSNHLSNSCLKATINCIFAESGCPTNTTREDMNAHLQDSTNFHLQLLLSAFKRMNTLIQELHRNVPFSRQPSLRSDLSSSIVAEASGTTYSSDNTLEYQISEELEDISLTKELQLSKVDWNISSESEVAQLSMLESKGKPESGEKSNSSKISKGGNSMKNMMSDLSNKTVDLDQMVMENMIKLKRMQGEIELSMGRTRKELDAKSCNGDFVWRIPNFLEFCNRSHLLYSSCFYSSSFGYRFRLRMKIYDRDNVSHVSLHIQVVQGENDDFLDWPFTGSITFSIMDCNEDHHPKNHITEEMNITESLQAFERPRLEKVSKDYGFREFIPVHKLTNGGYLNSKCLYIRVVVKYSQINMNSKAI